MTKTFILFVTGLFVLNSCTINSEISYHSDAASSTIMNIDIREFVAEMKAMTPDSLNKEFKEIDKLPTTWTSIYEIDKKEGKLKTSHPDSIKVMKKIFMKSNKEKNDYSGFSLKLDHFTRSDYDALNHLSTGNQLPVDQNVYNDWDGKVLTINTAHFNLKNLEEALRTSGSEEQSASTEGMLMMMFKQIGTTLKFENKIKSIQGKHDWLRQIDDRSVRIEYDIKAMYDKETKLKNSDNKIIITTE